MSSMNQNVTHTEKHCLFDDMQRLVNVITEAYHQGAALHEVEQSLFRQLMKVGHKLIDHLLELHGDGDCGEKLELSDGRQLRRLPEQKVREYLSVFGGFEFLRTVYGSRVGQKIEYIPLDAQLQLPSHKFSYLLQDWDQSLASEMPFAKVSGTIERILNLSQPVSSLERINRHLATSTDEFWDQQVLAPVAEQDQLVVLSVDCKGVVIRKTAKEKAEYQRKMAENPQKPASLDQSSPKANGRKKMAVLGAAYTIAPHVRTPECVLESLFRTQHEQSQEVAPKNRPKPLTKHIRASLLRDSEDTLQPAREEIFNWLQKESNLRSPTQNNPTILLMDGEKALWENGKNVLADNTVQILDLLHACSYVWDALHALEPYKSTKALIPTAKEIVGLMLNGKIKQVIRGFRWKATHKKLKGERLKKLKKACNYLKKNAHRMHYDKYLAAGFPIASGVIEGACRHVICDRMECSGMHWVMDGAKSMLGLRCIAINNSWNEFIKFHIQREQQSKFPVHAANQEIFHEAMLG